MVQCRKLLLESENQAFRSHPGFGLIRDNIKLYRTFSFIFLIILQIYSYKRLQILIVSNHRISVN